MAGYQVGLAKAELPLGWVIQHPGIRACDENLQDPSTGLCQVSVQTSRRGFNTAEGA